MESYFVYLLSRFALASVGHLPRASAIVLIEALARLAYRLDTVHRSVARTNLTIAFPELTTREHDRIPELPEQRAQPPRGRPHAQVDPRQHRLAGSV